MIAYFALLLALLSHVIPHPGLYNFTAVGAGLMFFGARRSRWQIAIATIVMAASDYYLTTHVYSYPFHVQGYLITWAWYAGVALMGSALLRRATALRVGIGVLTSATSFFLLSNFAVWPHNPMYAQNFGGLMDCYATGLPYYGNDLMATAIFATVLFGLEPATRRVHEMLDSGKHAI
jgi:hypothetical protein